MEVVLVIALVIIALNTIGISGTLKRLTAHHEKWPAPGDEEKTREVCEWLVGLENGPERLHITLSDIIERAKNAL